MGTRVDGDLERYRFCQRRTEHLRRLMKERDALGVLPPAVGPTYFEINEEFWRMELREAVILEGANVPCELVRDGGGT